MIVQIKKGLNRIVTKNFRSKELECKCKNESCRSFIVNVEAINSLQKFRNIVGTPILVNSFFRCMLHNFKVGGSSLSRHLSGKAVDISLKTLGHLSKDDIEFALKKSGFKFVLFYESFVHADIDKR